MPMTCEPTPDELCHTIAEKDYLGENMWEKLDPESSSPRGMI